MKPKKDFQLQYLFEDMPVFFEHKDNLMIDATALAKKFGTEPKDYLRLERTKKLIIAIRKTLVNSADLPNIKDDFSMVYSSIQKKGTYMHRILALDFAGWLNPDFQVWMLQKIEYILFGYAQRQSKELSENAKRIKRMRALEAEYKDDPNYNEIQKLKTEINQAKRRISKTLQHQTDLMLDTPDEQ